MAVVRVTWYAFAPSVPFATRRNATTSRALARTLFCAAANATAAGSARETGEFVVKRCAEKPGTSVVYSRGERGVVAIVVSPVVVTRGRTCTQGNVPFFYLPSGGH